jgi:hypothetical protein
MQENLGTAGGEAPGGQDRLALLPGPDPLGDPVHEEVGDVVVREIAAGELLVVRPQPFAELRNGRS